MKRNLNLTLGALPSADGAYQFQVWAPFQEYLSLELIIPGVEPYIVDMKRDPDGYFTAAVSALTPDTLYYYCLADNKKYPDPASRYQPLGIASPSALVANAFNWSDQHWRGHPLTEYIIYELHVGTYTQEATFNAIIPYLDQLVDLGITAIELMPIAQFSGNRNWGYDGVLPFAVQNSYGGPEGLRQLVNACHNKNLAVILDVVYNHIGPEGNIFNQFGPYFTEYYHTPWGAAINFDGAYNHQVRRYFIENALYWFQEYHIDALRLDALDAIYDASAYPFLRELADYTHDYAIQSGRRLYLIAESGLNDTRLIQPKDQGGFGLDAQWNDDFHHALHTLLTKESHGYYQDFGQLRQFVKAYREGFVYSGQYSSYRHKPHGCSSAAIPAGKFVVFAQNHDQVGNRLKGDRLSESLSQLKLAAGLVILSPFIPLLFMGEEYAEIAPFNFFTSFTDPVLIDAVRRGRQQEFVGFLQETIPDPQSINTFVASKLQHPLKDQPENRYLFQYYQRLILLRKSNPALSNLNTQELDISVDETTRVVRVHRTHQQQQVLLLFHFNAELTQVTLATNSVTWNKILDSADVEWGGDGSKTPEIISAAESVTLALPPFAFMVFINTA